MASSRIMLYSFIEEAGKVKLHINFTSYLLNATNHHSDKLQIQLPKLGTYELKKAEYLNTGKVFCKGSYFFIVATKFMGKKAALNCLLEFACERSQKRLSLYKKLLAA